MAHDLSRFDEMTVRVLSHGGTFEGAAFWYPADFGECEFGIAEESLRIDDRYFFQSDVDTVELLREEIFVPLREYIEIRERAVRWFRYTSGLPTAFWEKTLAACIADKTPLPQWYIALRHDRFVAGCGVDEDGNAYVFHASGEASAAAVADDLRRFAREDLAERGIAWPDGS